jgi:hypothetical protein
MFRKEKVMRNRRLMITLSLFMLALAACAPPSPVLITFRRVPSAMPLSTAAPPPTDVPATETPAAEPTAEEAPTEPPAEPGLPPDPQSISFQTADGLTLTGTFFPAATLGRPVVVLMHWAGGDETDWFAPGKPWPQVALIIQNRQDELAGLSPVLGRRLRMAQASYNVMTFNFRGYGTSEDGPGDLYLDAQAAVAFAKTLEGVDPSRVLTVGASIGADGAVDGCAGGACIGAVSLSPGNYIGMDYAQAVMEAGDIPIACVASQGDAPSPDVCAAGMEAAGGSDKFQVQIYEGDAHGMLMFPLDQQPDLLDYLLNFLDTAYTASM